MPDNNFNFIGGALEGYEVGERVGKKMGDRYLQYRSNRAAKKAGKAIQQLQELGVVDKDGTISDDGSNPVIAELKAARDKEFQKLRKYGTQYGDRTGSGTKQIKEALNRFRPIGGIPSKQELADNGVGAEVADPSKPLDASAPPSLGSVQAVKPVAAESPYDPAFSEVGYQQQFSKLTDTQLNDPKQLEALNNQAVLYHGGRIIETAKGAMSRVLGGKVPTEADYAKPMTFDPREVDEIAGNAAAALPKIPGFERASVEVNAGQVFIDPDGEGGAEGYALATVGDVIKLNEMLESGSLAASESIPRQQALELANTAEQKKAIQDSNNATRSMFEKLFPNMNKATHAVMTAGLTATNAANAKVATIDPDMAAMLETNNPDFKVQGVINSPNGPIYTMTNSVAADSTGVPVKKFMGPQGEISASEYNKMLGGKEDAVTQMLIAANNLDANGYNTAVDGINTISTAISQGKVAQLGKAIPTPLGGSTGGGNYAGLPAETQGYISKVLGASGGVPDGTPEQQAEYMLPFLQEVESAGNNAVDDTRAVSPKGAVGPFQIMPATAKAPGYGLAPIDLNNSTYEEQKAFATDYLAAMFKAFPGRPDLAIGAYNAGEGTVDKWLAKNPQSIAPSVAQGSAVPASAVAATAVPPQPKAAAAPQRNPITSALFGDEGLPSDILNFITGKGG